MLPYVAAAIQMNSQPDLKANLAQAEALIRQAADEEAVLVGLPEHFAFFGDITERFKKTDEIETAVPVFLRRMARTFGIYLLGGSYPVSAGKGKVYNRSLLLNPEGEIVSTYDKIHLFDVNIPDGFTYRESRNVAPGKKTTHVFSSEYIGHIGLSICYDLRFPELYRKLTEKGSEVLCVPSAFTHMTGKAHWHILLKARAIENTSYIFAPAQAGLHGEKRRTYGHAVIIDPWGEVLADAGDKPGLALAQIDPVKLRDIRMRMPSLRHRVMD